MVCSDITAINSGTGKVGGACFWYLEFFEAACFVGMCRLYSLVCLASIDLTVWNIVNTLV